MHTPIQRPRFGRRLVTLAFWLGALAGPAAAAQLQAYAGAVGGRASGFDCGTIGPTLDYGGVSGIRLPTGGFAGCNLQGAIVDKSSAAGPLTAQQNVTATWAEGGSFVGQANARANYGNLGVAATGAMTGPTSALTFHQTAGFARYQDTMTLNRPGIATGTPGTVDFAFLIDGILSSLPNPPYSQQADIGLGIRVGSGIAPGRAPWFAFQATVVGDGLPFVRGGSTGLPGSFALTPGSLSGSANILSTANFAMRWGEPFEVEVAFMATVEPCCYGTSLAAEFMSTARLSGISAQAAGVTVTDFTVLSGSGTAYGPGGLLPVPEPTGAMLWTGGLLMFYGMRRRIGRKTEPGGPSIRT